MSYSGYQRIMFLLAVVIFAVLVFSNVVTGMVFAGGCILGLIIGILFKLADEAGEVPERNS